MPRRAASVPAIGAPGGKAPAPVTEEASAPSQAPSPASAPATGHRIRGGRAGRRAKRVRRPDAERRLPRGVRRVAVAAAVVLIVGLSVVALHRQPRRLGIQVARGSGPLAEPARAAVRAPTIVAAPSADPGGEVQAPAPGLYRYRSTFSAGAKPSEFAERVTSEASPPGTTTDHIFATTGVDTTVAFTPTQELELAYGQVGTRLTDELTCRDDPPQPLLDLPLQPAKSWSSSTTCSNFLNDQVRDERQFRVTGRTTQPVGLTAVPVWEVVIVDTQTDVPSSGGPVTTRKVTVTEDISARYGLVVRRVTEQASDPGSQETDQLVTLTPG